MPAVESAPPPRTVTVVGEGVVDAPPDLAVVRIGVESTALSVDEALAESRRIVAEIIEALGELGVAESDMQTANYNFNFDRSAEPPAAPRSAAARRYYRVNNMLTVTIRDLSSTADIIDAAVIAGANQMWGVDFGVADPHTVERATLRAASLDARERAEYLARLSGLSLGEIVSVSEVFGVGASVAFRAEGAPGPASGVSPGMIRFSSRLQVVYTLVPIE